jgi:hypothetical protein
MNIGRVFCRRIAGGDREFWRRQMIDHVRWLRRVWVRWLFDHVVIRCNMVADEGVIS